MTYLIPLRLLTGQLPTRHLLTRFPALDQLYSPFVKAIRRGDLKSYDEALSSTEGRLADLGVLLAIEKAREVCLRCLFRKM